VTASVFSRAVCKPVDFVWWHFLPLQRGQNFTALGIAADKGHIEAVIMLIKAGANVNLRTSDGYTALMVASHRGYTAMVQALIRAGADPNLQDMDVRSRLLFDSRSYLMMAVLCTSKGLHCAHARRP
jgi:hypothetical protein